MFQKKVGARWPSELERSTGDRTVDGSNPTSEKLFASELWQFRLPPIASVFRRRH